MRVIIWGINYAPELTGIAPYNVALCEFLLERGDHAEVLTTFAYYPTWHKRSEDRGRLYRDDVVNGSHVHRCWHYVPRQLSAAKRILHEASFVLTSALRALLLARADIYVVISPPLLLGAAAWLVCKIKRSMFVFHVQDLQPDAAVGLGMLQSGWLIKALYALEGFAYRKAARVSAISRGMLDIQRGKGVPDPKQVYFPNGVLLEDAVMPDGSFRSRLGFDPEDFVAVYAGNLGVKQGLGVIIEAAALLAGSAVQLVICGDGAQRNALARQVEDRLLRNVRMLPLQPVAEYQAMLADADVCLITQQPGAGKAFFPSKLLSTLAAAKPVVTVADHDSELARATADGGFGINVPPNQPDRLAECLLQLSRDRTRLQHFAKAGRAFVEQFEMKRVLSRFAEELDRLAGP